MKGLMTSATQPHVLPSIVPSLPDALDDQALSAWLAARALREKIYLVDAAHRCFIFSAADTRLYPADPAISHKPLLEALGHAKQLFHLSLNEQEVAGLAVAPSNWPTLATRMGKTAFGTWWKRRAGLFDSGRGKSLPDRAVRRIWHEAGGRCMFEGCGEDLGGTPLSVSLSQIAYLAHIVAADEDGPRGSAAQSLPLSDDPENILLMCDAHHRLIDRIDANGFPVARLREMRARHVEQVRKQLESLAYPRSQGLALLTNIAGAASAPTTRDMRAAILDNRLSPLPVIESPLRGMLRDDRVPETFWRQLLREHELDLMQLVRRFDGSQTSADPFDVLSVFPFTSIPLLVLCGRIIGEGRPVKVHQYDPARGSFRWDPSRQAQSEGSFFLDAPAESSTCDEVLLSVELTAHSDFAALPADLALSLQSGQIRHVRIRAITPNSQCIGTEADLLQFTRRARDAVALVHDVLRAKKVHFIGVSPASSLFSFGQLLRGGHHPDYVIYDRADRQRPFRPAIILSGQQVSDALPLDSDNRSVTLR